MSIQEIQQQREKFKNKPAQISVELVMCLSAKCVGYANHVYSWGFDEVCNQDLFVL